MQPLNAIDAISPAFTRMQQILFKPFKLGRTFKFAATSYLALAGSLFIPFPLFLLLLPRVAASFGSPLPAEATSTLFVGALLLSLVYVALFYLLVRLELVDYEVVATRAPLIAPVWRRYSARVWPWLGLTIALGTLASALIAPILVLVGKHFFTEMIPLFAAFAGPQDRSTPPDLKTMLALYQYMAAFYGIAIALFMIPKTLSTLANDFALPVFLLENVSLSASLRGGARIFLADPLQSVLYLLMKLLLSLTGFAAQYVVSQIMLLPFTLVAVLIGVLGGLLAAHMGPAGQVLLVVGAVVLFTALILCVFYITIGTFGCVTLFLDAYGIFFVGSRYRPLGDLLEPSPAQIYTYAPPPSVPAPEKTDDPDDGPSLPMDPALA